jgi:hypothetical protein
LALAATVANRGGAAAPASKMRFYLSADRRLSSHDKRLPRLGVHGLRAGEKETVHKSWKVPHSLRAGIYHVLACADVKHAVAEHSHCRVAKRTVAVTHPGDGRTEAAGGASPGAGQEPKSPKEEWHPQADGAPFQCPISFHGQGGNCVWVSTPTIKRNLDDPYRNEVVSVFSYCPRPYGWPFEVALGFDPMWENLGTNSAGVVENVAKQKWTLYTTVAQRQYYPSYGAPNELDGYISIHFRPVTLDSAFVRHNWVHKARYLCADRHATSMLP